MSLLPKYRYDLKLTQIDQLSLTEKLDLFNSLLDETEDDEKIVRDNIKYLEDVIETLEMQLKEEEE